jgi:hypothetical protein
MQLWRTLAQVSAIAPTLKAVALDAIQKHPPQASLNGQKSLPMLVLATKKRALAGGAGWAQGPIPLTDLANSRLL